MMTVRPPLNPPELSIACLHSASSESVRISHDRGKNEYSDGYNSRAKFNRRAVVPLSQHATRRPRTRDRHGVSVTHAEGAMRWGVLHVPAIRGKWLMRCPCLSIGPIHKTFRKLDHTMSPSRLSRSRHP